MKQKKRKKFTIGKLISLTVFFSLILSIVFVVVMLCLSEEKVLYESYGRTKSDYVLMLLQCVLGLIAMLLPSIFAKKWKLEIPSLMQTLYLLFLFGAIYLGEVRNFYYVIPHWDVILHAFSGAMLGALGFSVVSLMNDVDSKHLKLSPGFVAFFAFCFALALGVIWEIYEFSFDGFLGLNMQKFRLEDGTELIGRAALLDTMKDLIVDSIGALSMSIVGYLSLKYQKGWIKKLSVRKKGKKV